MIKVSTERLTDVFVEVADTLIEEFDLIEFLQMLTQRIAELVDAPAVGLLLADQRGSLQFMAASTEGAHLLELFQLQNHEGPCLDAFRTGEPVHQDDLTQAAARWPRFARHAVADGYLSVHAVPLRLRRQTIGAMGIFAAQTGAIDTTDAHTMQALGDVATIALLQERSISHNATVTEQLQNALNSRIIIEQAKGALAQHLGLGVDEAFEALRAHARRTQTRLGVVATAVLTDPTEMNRLTGSYPS